MSIVSLAEAKAHLLEVVSRVSSHHETCDRHSSLSPVRDPAGPGGFLEETINVLSDSEVFRDPIAPQEGIATGRVESADDLAQAMSRRRSPR